MKKIGITITLMILAIMVFSETQKIDIFKDKMLNIKREKVETLECVFEISMGDGVSGKSKMYMSGNRLRIDIQGETTERGINDMIIVQDSAGSYTKMNNKWIKGKADGGNSIVNQMKIVNQEESLKGIMNKNDFTVESIKGNQAVVSFKEAVGLIGPAKTKMGIDLNTGNIMFQEQNFNEGRVIIDFKYDNKSGIIPSEVNIRNIENKVGEPLHVKIRISDVKVNHKLDEAVFLTDEIQNTK